MNLLTECRNVFQDARKSIFEGIALLHKISTEKLWDGSYSSFGEYVEQELQLHPTQASRYLKAYEHYVLQGKVSLARLNSTNPERLYWASNLKGNVDEQLTRAESWTVREIRDELSSSEKGDCQHDHLIQICAKCNKRIS